MSNDKELKISSAGKGYLPKAAELISRTFTEDPVIKFMLSSLSDEDRLAYMPTYMHTLLKAATLNDGLIQEANDWCCCAVWMPPGKRVDNIFTMIPAGILGCFWKNGVAGIRRMLLDFGSQSDACKQKYLRDSKGNPVKRHHYLYFIATDLHARGQGLASKMIARWQEKALEDGLPIWLEATTPRSRDIYARRGFKVVEEMRVGKGTHVESGTMEEGGNGVPLWAMIWWPEWKKDSGITHGSQPEGTSRN
ncbi:hypothetical protein LTR37_018955 [Vermiconidia calcicola]|uniref:Uncharacterized protein n=1 Tax=Vermiconidia calcicola TaxID=1690605 RepID=A0ACC3MFV8_9PEZI|nr:hypothetical protein LTR37_018955 [Vermiconidia calcicola]